MAEEEVLGAGRGGQATRERAGHDRGGQAVMRAIIVVESPKTGK